MPLNKRNTREFMRQRKIGVNAQVLILYKRGPDQQQGTVVAHKLFTCWRDGITRTGQTLRETLSSSNSATWHIPLAELNRSGVSYLTANDKLYDPVEGKWWTPYASTQVIENEVYGNVVDVMCKQCSPLGPFG